MSQPSIYQKIKEAVESIRSGTPHKPEIGIVLGSGLGAVADQVTDPVIIPYTDIPHFYRTTIEGHKGQAILGKISGVPVVVLQGRFHFYEGHSMEDVVFPTRAIC